MVKLITAPLLLIVLHLALSPSADAVLNVWVSNCNNTDGNYTTNSPYKTNLDTLFTKATTTDIDYGFYNLTAGQSPDAVNLISLCLGNIGVIDCHTCQSYVINSLKVLCPNQKTAIAWSDDCVVRYSNKPILGALAEEPGFLMLRGLKASGDDAEEYKSVVKTLLESLPGNASIGDSRRKFASAQDEFNSSLTVFAAAQCTPDLTQKECSDCLEVANTEIKSCPDCPGQRGARVLLPSCTVRYEENKFYMSDSPAPTPSPSQSQSPTPSPGKSPSPATVDDSPVAPSAAPTSTTVPSHSQSPTPSPETVDNSPVAPSTAPKSTTVPSPDAPSATPTSAVVPSAVTPSAKSPANNAAKESIGSRSSIVALIVVGACLSALLL